MSKQPLFDSSMAVSQAIQLSQQAGIRRKDCDNPSQWYWHLLEDFYAVNAYQLKLGEIIARYFAANKYIPQAVVCCKADKKWLRNCVGSAMSDYLPDGKKMKGLNLAVIDIPETARLISGKNVLYISEALPTFHKLSEIEKMTTHAGATEIHFGSLYGPAELQDSARFSILSY